MTTPSIEELTTPATADETFEKMLDMLEAVQIPARSWAVGGVFRTILRVVASLFAALSVIVSNIAKMGILEKAEGAWLDLLAWFGYGVLRIPATFATGSLTFDNSAGGGSYSFAARAFRAQDSVTKKVYTNVSATSITPGATVTFDIIAEEAGALSTAQPGEITVFVAPANAPGATLSNAAALVGVDAESDAELRQSAKDKLGSVTNGGPRGAYAYAVRHAERTDGSIVDVNRVSISRSSSKGFVTMYVASASGPLTIADLAFVNRSVELLARPDTVTARAYNATTVPFSRTITIWASRTDGVSASDIEDFAQAAETEFLATYPIGGNVKPPSTQGYLYGDAVTGIAKSSHPSIFDVDIDNTADMPLDTGEIAVLTLVFIVNIVDGEAA